MAITKSTRFQFTKEDLFSVGKGLLIAVAGAILTYLTEFITQLDLGVYTPIIVATWSVMVNVIRKYIGEHRYIV
jgi:hypothetical protein